MWKCIAGWVSRRVRAERVKLATGETDWNKLLSAERVESLAALLGAGQRCGLYSPLVTLWTFLSQVLSPDHSCREAVAKLRAFLSRDGQEACNPDTSPYCKARKRLPELLCAWLAVEAGTTLHERVREPKLLGGRSIKLVDGTTVSMPDTAANQRAYPQIKSQKPGLGFPIARVVGLLSLVSGAVVGLAIGPYKGKGTGETALFRQLWDLLQSGDIIVGDRHFATFWDLAMLAARGIDGVYRQHHLRLTKNQRIRRLGAEDFLLCIPKPQRPKWMPEETYAELPSDLVVRELEVQVKQRGFRVRHLTLVTTLLDSNVYSASELANVYRARWNAELYLRSIKITMQMDVLRCKTPEMVRKEIWMHLLAYNLIRTVMADAAQRHGCQPREISFKGTLQTLGAYRPQVETAPADVLPDLYEEVLFAVASHRVGSRPNRFEPRAIKRRPKPHDFLTIPRKEAKRRLVA